MDAAQKKEKRYLESDGHLRRKHEKGEALFIKFAEDRRPELVFKYETRKN